MGAVNPRGSPQSFDSAFLDTNFLVSCLMKTDRFNRHALAFLHGLLPSVRAGKKRLFVSARVLEEVVWTCWRVLHDREHGRGSFSALSQAQRLASLPSYRGPLKDIVRLLLSHGMPYEIAELSAGDFADGAEIVLEHAIPLPDAMHVAMARRLCDGFIVTNDRHMRALPDVTCITYGLPAE